ncbi:MAG: 3-oxoacyl-(acyl-carrier-protein) reductase [Clostridiales bacterium]|nr:3-oxoacyl-(acyl-carrier-protein) reductase [Clostridiales bacterium]
MKLDGKVAIITGCARGIGKATAQLFIKEGARLLINDLSNDIEVLKDELIANGGEVICYTGDVSDFKQVEEMVQTALNHFGKIDILVNTVALPQRKGILDTSIEEFDRVINVNLKAAFYPCKAVLPHMVQRRYGKIVNVASIAGIRGGGILGKSTYAGSKAGVIGLTKGIAREVAEYGINVNVVAPGLTNTPRNNVETPENISRAVAAIPLKRMGEPEDMAPTILHLASDDTRFITGTVSVIDGGFTMM